MSCNKCKSREIYRDGITKINSGGSTGDAEDIGWAWHILVAVVDQW